MSTINSDDSKDASTSLFARVSDLRDRFESEWRRGERPRIESCLTDSGLPVETLLPKLLSLELSQRRGLGERPTREEYLARFPESHSIVEGAFASLTTRDGAPDLAPVRAQEKPRRDASHHLLVGILALQNGFLDHVALIRAIQTWARDKSRGLGSILVDEGKLDPTKLSLLESLADEHHKRNGDDLPSSLASFGALAPVLQAVRGMGDPDVDTSFASATGPGATSEETVFISGGDDLATDAGGRAASTSARFQDFRFYRAGALGKVFNALDRELNRRVAFKEIQDQYAHQPSSRDQFMLEGLVTGGLEHPGIVPVYSLGCREDGRPFYAMRFIQGPSLRDRLGLLHDRKDARSLEPGEDPPTLPRLLRHFVNACHAVAYAHSRGVLHRDLKPDHVMLGPFGETLVVDWGLAMPILNPGERGRMPEETLHLPRDYDSVLGQDGMIVGTPAYMSPEQAQGLQSQLDRTSDVYSLGAVLYSILTGDAPFQGGDFITILEKARAGDFSPPRQIKGDAPAPLEAICLKAMAFRKDDRYESAGALARDVEHWLDDEPVDAYPEPWPARAGRWLRRNRAVAVGGATALLSAMVGLIALNIQTSRANTQIAAAHAQAETNFAMALDIVKNLLGDVVGADLPKLPGTEALWQKVAEQAAQSMEKLQAQRSNDPKVLMSAAAAYRKLANVLRLYGDDGASSSYRRATELLYKAIQLDGSNPLHRDYLAEVLFDAAEAERARGRPNASDPLYQEAIKIASALADEFPDKPDYRRTKARSSYNYADRRLEAGDFPEAIRLLEEAVRVLRPFADAERPGPSDRVELALVLVSLGTALNGEAGSAAADGVLREAIRRAESLLDATADDPDTRFIRASAQVELSRATFASQPDAAIGQLDEAVREMQRLVNRYPETEHYHFAEAAALEARSNLLIARNRPQAAAEDLGLARDKLASLLKGAPAHPVYSGVQGRVLGALGQMLIGRGSSEEARELLREASRLQGVALKANPQNPIDLQASRRHEELLRHLDSESKPSPRP